MLRNKTTNTYSCSIISRNHAKKYEMYAKILYNNIRVQITIGFYLVDLCVANEFNVIIDKMAG